MAKFGEYSVRLVIAQRNNGERKSFIIETFQESKQLEETKIFLLKNIDKIIEKSWGKFGKEFIIKHIVRSDLLKLVKTQDKIIAIASATRKRILGKQILYLEFTAINQEYQGYNFSTVLNGDLVAEQYFRGLFSRNFAPLHVVTITRNLRVLGALSAYATTIYPDPEEFNQKQSLSPANDFTWNLVNKIIAESWNPKRAILREGNVLVGSYENSPWLILPKTQKHHRNSVKEMGEKYLEISAKSDREFIVHATFNLFSILRYYFWKRNQHFIWK